MNGVRRCCAIALLFLIATCWSTLSFSEEYPSRPIRLIVPVPPGGPLDLSSRVLAEGLSQRLKQPVVVENRPGGGTLIATRAVAAAEPDGYTLLMSSPSIATYQSFVKDARIDILTDLEPIGIVATLPYVLVASTKRDIKSIAELLAFGRANPGTLNFATYGNASYLVTGIFNQAANIEATRVPYAGSAAAHTSLMSGDVDYMLTDFGTVRPLLTTGKIRLLGVCVFERLSEMPDVPTLREAGLDAPELTSWEGLFAPGKTPASIVNRLKQDAPLVMKSPEALKKLAGLHMSAAPLSDQSFRDKLQREQALYDGIAKKLGVIPE